MADSRNTNRFYLPHTPDANHQAAKLLRHVNRANYQAANQLSTENAAYMFLNVKQADDTITTPLKRAIHNLDTYTLLMFYDKIKNNPEALQEFIRQIMEQQEHIELQPLFDTYRSCKAAFHKWTKHLIDDEEANNQWLRLGRAQREYLPLHMLREYCRENTILDYSSFDVDKKPAPQGGNVLLRCCDKILSLDASEFAGHLGSDFALVRGGSISQFLLNEKEAPCRRTRPWALPKPDLLKHHRCSVAPYFKAGLDEDVRALKTLFATRKSDLAELRDALTPLAAPNLSPARSI